MPQSYINCRCIPSTERFRIHGFAKQGTCDRDCKNLIPFLFGAVVLLIFNFMNATPNKTVVLRYVLSRTEPCSYSSAPDFDHPFVLFGHPPPKTQLYHEAKRFFTIFQYHVCSCLQAYFILFTQFYLSLHCYY